MPKSKPLTDAAIAQLKPGLQPYKRTDGGTPGLHLWVSGAGTKTWRFRYQRDKREFVMTLGHYQPKVPKHHMSLDRARSEAYRLKAEIRTGAHPAGDRNREREPEKYTFKYVAESYIDYFLHGTVKKRKPAASTAAYTQRALKACKPLHDRGIADIKPAEFQEVIFKQVKDENFESARKVRSFLNKTCAYAYGMGYIPRNPIPGLPRPPTPGDTEKGYAALLEPEAFGKLLRTIEAYDGNKIIKTALQILPHIFVRPGELRFATWREVNFKKHLWTIPAARMKSNKEHKIPLSKQVWFLLADLELDIRGTADSDDYVFPSSTHRDRPMSENTLNYALRAMGIDTKTQHTAHGFRKTASTLLNGARKDKDLIELSLAHGDPDRIRDKYNFAELLEHRAVLMQDWSDMIDGLKAGKPLIAE